MEPDRGIVAITTTVRHGSVVLGQAAAPFSGTGPAGSDRLDQGSRVQEGSVREACWGERGVRRRCTTTQENRFTVRCTTEGKGELCK